jgi:benzoate 4-monooxygenase
MDIVSLLPTNKFLRYAALLGIVGIVALVFHQVNHPLRKYPAANVFVTIPYVGEIWFAWLTLKGDPDRTLRELHKKLGKFVRIGPNEVSIDDSDAVKELYGHGNDIEKGISTPI